MTTNEELREELEHLRDLVHPEEVARRTREESVDKMKHLLLDMVNADLEVTNRAMFVNFNYPSAKSMGMVLDS